MHEGQAEEWERDDDMQLILADVLALVREKYIEVIEHTVC